MTVRRPDEITSFYDAHPYPPPIDNLDSVARQWQDGQLRRIEHFRMWPSMPYRDDHWILVAGCGTSQAAKYAVRYPRARVVGIDVSPSSLEQTRQLAARHRLHNLELVELAIEQLDQLGQSFDHIVCTGVLHHLADPNEGLRSLRGVLNEMGALQLMLYAPYGRTGVYMIQEYCRLLGVRPEQQEIDELIDSLRELPAGHPLGHLLRNTPDFGNADALADALLNPRDRAYSVPDIFKVLDETGLRFGRWVRQAPYVPRCGVLRSLPHGSRIATLPLAEQYHAVELFRGTMTRHSFIAYRNDCPDTSINFGGDDWPNHVPIRTAAATVVKKKLPPGASAAILNRAHTFTDLVLFVDDRQLDFFERIDGTRPMAELGDVEPEFVEQLWWQDAIVVSTGIPLIRP